MLRRDLSDFQVLKITKHVFPIVLSQQSHFPSINFIAFLFIYKTLFLMDASSLQ